MTDDTKTKREEIRKQLLAVKTTDEQRKAAQATVQANEAFDKQLASCLDVNTKVLTRKITV